MLKRAVRLLVAGAVLCALAPVGGWAAGLGGGAPQAASGEAAVAYANALALGNAHRGWELLSAASKQGMEETQWQRVVEARPAAMKAQPMSILRAIVMAPEAPVVSDVLTREGDSYMEVKSNVQITQRVVVVKEGTGWRVDLAASDKLNARDAGEIFLAAVRDDALGSQNRAARAPASALPLLRAVFAPQAKDFKVVRVEGDQTRADVVVGAEVPVSLVVRASRSGAGWVVDFTRPLSTDVDMASPHPLQDAVEASVKSACQEQMRQLASAIQMYAASSDDMLPDPKRWLDQVSPFLPQPARLHCPSDPKSGISYAMNSNLAGKRRRDVGNQGQVPLLFESTLHVANASDAGQSWPTTAWHDGGPMVLYLDGQVKQAPTKPSFEAPKAIPGARPAGPARPQTRPGAPGSAPGGAPPARPAGRIQINPAPN